MKLTSHSFMVAFGSITKAAEQLGCSRRAIYDWLEQGQIPEKCDKGINAGAEWHKRLKKLGFNSDLSQV